MPNVEAAIATLQEARLLSGTGADADQVNDALDVAIKLLKDEEITDDDLQGLHPAPERRVRDILGR